jgi:hypothetical protein
MRSSATRTSLFEPFFMLFARHSRHFNFSMVIIHMLGSELYSLINEIKSKIKTGSLSIIHP